MRIRKAVITAAGRDQRTLPMQTIIDQQGAQRSVLSLIVGEAVGAGIEDICIVVWPGDEEPYAKLLTGHTARLTFVPQTEARGYAHAVNCAREFAADEPFLHLLGDHIYVSAESGGCCQASGGSRNCGKLRGFGRAGDKGESSSAVWRRRRATGSGQARVLSGGRGAGKAHPDGSRTTVDRSGSAQRALPVLLWHARAHAGHLRHSDCQRLAQRAQCAR